MRKIIAVGLTLILLTCAFYSASFFSKIATSEYALLKVSDFLDELAVNPDKFSRRQKLNLVNNAIKELEAAADTAVNAQRSYELKAKLYYNLSDIEVWPVKREQYLKQAVYNNYNALNINHYALQPWLLDLQMQNQVDSDQAEFYWSLANVLTLGKWDYDVLDYASFYCVLKWKKMPLELKQPCSDALQNASQNETRKKRLYSQLSRIYRFEDVVAEMTQ